MKRLLLTLVFVLSCQLGHAQKTITVPMEKLPTGHYAVEATINNGQKTKFWIDTGANFTVIPERTAKKWNLPLSPLPSFLKSDPAMLSVQAVGMITVENFDIGDISYKMPVVVARKFFSKKSEGVLGVNTFVKGAVLFQWQKRKLTIFYPGSMTPDLIDAYEMRDSLIVPIRKEDDIHIYRVLVTSDNKEPYEMLIDTGSDKTMIPKKNQAGWDTTIVGKPRTYGMVSGQFRVQAALLHQMRLGTWEIKNLAIFLSEIESDLIIGLDVLTQSDLLIDFPAKKMYIKRPAKP